ncbi:MAG: HNH endonuclease [Proteobacteria bacterium]|nr:MAG: HNH endonuclease [Pseudomonadota bacterium]
MQSNEQMFLQKLSDAELLFDTREAIKTEREATSIVVKYFREISARELYLKHACSSLFQFATEKLGYCAASAQARINAMELVVALPEVEKKLESGELSLTAAAKVQSFFRAEKKAKKIYSETEKLAVVQVCLSKSTREIDRELASRNPEVARIDSVKPVGADSFELRVTISEELEDKIRKLKDLLAHSQPTSRTEELLEMLVELGLEKFDPARKAERAVARAATKHKRCISEEADSEKPAEFNDESLRAHETEKPSRYVSVADRHQVWIRNAGRGCEFTRNAGRGCEFTAANEETCGSQYALQIDHVYGVARGGANDQMNLRILCAKHNRFVWRETLRGN